MALGILLIMFVSVSVISVLGVLIMFLSKSTKVKKAAFYAMSIWGMVLAVLSAPVCRRTILASKSLPGRLAYSVLLVCWCM